MVKSILVIIGITVMVSCVSTGDSAGSLLPANPVGALRSYGNHVVEKFARGATNMARAGGEFYAQPVEARRESGSAVAALWPGLGEGLGMCLTRIIGGGLEMGLAPFPFPNGWQPLLDE
jgi:hypothetical protein